MFTLTGNLLCERTLEFSDWSIGRTQRAARSSFQVGGKGINVAKMLHRLGAPVSALCFTGGETGAECEAWLRAQKFQHQAFACARPTRVGIVIRSATHPETTFFSPDVAPDAASVELCAKFLDAQPDGLVLAVCGSIPGWDASDFDPLRAAFTRWQARGILAADTYGPPLAWFAAQSLALVKINASELRTLFPSADPNVPTSDLLALATKRWTAKSWIVTDGGSPVWFCERGGRPESLQPPAITEVSATGSGDVLFACVLEFLFQKRTPFAEALARALPYAAANAAHPGIAEFPDP